jgi:hypothetical protein
MGTCGWRVPVERRSCSPLPRLAQHRHERSASHRSRIQLTGLATLRHSGGARSPRCPVACLIRAVLLQVLATEPLGPASRASGLPSTRLAADGTRARAQPAAFILRSVPGRGHRALPLGADGCQPSLNLSGRGHRARDEAPLAADVLLRLGPGVLIAVGRGKCGEAAPEARSAGHRTHHHDRGAAGFRRADRRSCRSAR